jgi:hypothetical protein
MYQQTTLDIIVSRKKIIIMCVFISRIIMASMSAYYKYDKKKMPLHHPVLSNIDC